METLLYLVGPLGCAVMMAVCMAMMARGMPNKPDADSAEDSQEIAALRAEVAELRSERSRVHG